MRTDPGKADQWFLVILVLMGPVLFVTLPLWPEIGRLLAGLAVFALGALMVFAPGPAERLHERFSWIKTGGTLREPMGWLGMLIGSILTVIWCVRYLP
jgi:hypothetical protein